MQVTKRCVVLFALALVIACLPAMAARVSVATVTHTPLTVFQAYPGNSLGFDLNFLGYNGVGADVITAVPGVLTFDASNAWSNFVGAANANSLGGFWPHFYPGTTTNYQIKNVVLTKQTPSFIECSGVYAPKTVVQQGSPKIRTWWPLMYEAPGTTWTLVITYGTPQFATINPITGQTIFVDYVDAPGVNPGSSVHQEQWQWMVDANFQSLSFVLALFHEIPFGMDEVPLISDEDLYVALQAKVAAIQAFLAPGVVDVTSAANVLADFELEVEDACISSSPASPAPGGSTTGIAQTDENPACCKLIVDAEYLSQHGGPNGGPIYFAKIH